MGDFPILWLISLCYGLFSFIMDDFPAFMVDSPKVVGDFPTYGWFPYIYIYFFALWGICLCCRSFVMHVCLPTLWLISLIFAGAIIGDGVPDYGSWYLLMWISCVENKGIKNGIIIVLTEGSCEELGPSFRGACCISVQDFIPVLFVFGWCRLVLMIKSFLRPVLWALQ